MIEYIKMIPLSFFFALPWTLIVFALGTYIFRDNKIKININTLPNIKVNNDTDCIVKIIPPTDSDNAITINVNKKESNHE